MDILRFRHSTEIYICLFYILEYLRFSVDMNYFQRNFVNICCAVLFNSIEFVALIQKKENV